jgi:hypothetical protein
MLKKSIVPKAILKIAKGAAEVYDLSVFNTE